MKMFRILKLVLLAAATNCAPATFIPFAAPFAQPYFFIGPQPQYQPLLKIPQPAAGPAATIDSPTGQYIFLYQNAPQIPLRALRQEDGGTPDFFEQVINWWSDFSSSFSQNPSAEQAPVQPATENSDNKMSKSLSEKKMDMEPLLPASTMPLNPNKQRFYILNSLPQFYAPLPVATIANPVLAIHPLRARSAVDSISAENEKVEQIRSQDINEPVQLSGVVQPIPQLQLRSNIVEPLQRLEINQPQVPFVNNEPVPEAAAEQVARLLEQVAPNVVNKGNENEVNQLRTSDPLEEETSIAQAKPSGIAISGKGGLSSSSPVATAVVGENGQAVASPTAISLSGDFENEQKNLKRIEPIAPL